MKLRIGLIGLGEQWETRYRPALRMLDDRFDVRAVYCTISKLAESTAAEFQADPIDGYRSLVYRCDIDAVLILKQCWLGWLPALAACQAGKAVYWGAGLDFDPAHQIAVRHAIEQSGVSFMAELPRRYAPATIRLKELIATRLGAPRLLFCHERLPVESQSNRLRRGDYCPIAWRNLMELVDWCRYLIGEDATSLVSSVHHNVDATEPTADSIYYQMLSLDFPFNDKIGARPLAQLSIGHYIPERWIDAVSYRRPASIQVCCEHGLAFIDLPSTLVWFDEGGQHTESLDADRDVGELMLDHFHRAVTSLIRKTAGLEDAYRALNIVLKANESAKTGNRIELG